MADKKLSSVNAVSDMNFVYAETSTGETVKISKADLASVVADLMLQKKLYPFMQMGYVSDANNTLEGGVYRCASNTNNIPAPYGMIMVFNSGAGYVTQIYSNSEIHKYRFYNGMSFSSWI